MNCPVCATPCTAAPINEYTPEQAASYFCPRTRDADRHARFVRCITRLWAGGNCRVLVCAACGFGFGDPFVGGDEEFYGILHEQAGYPSARWEYTLARDLVLKAAPASGNVLDIGAGHGLFLNAFPPTWKRFATEGSESTRAKLVAEGIGVFPDLESAAARMPGAFQLVTAFQVMEHIAEFRAIYEASRRLLAPGGSLVLSVPNRVDMEARERIVRAPDMPPNHINKWTPKSMTLALKQAGFTSVDTLIAPPSRAAFAWGVSERMVTDAAERPRSISALLYRVHSRPVRRMLLRGWGAAVALSLLPHYPTLNRSCCLIAIASAG